MPRISSNVPGLTWGKPILESAFLPLRCVVTEYPNLGGFAVRVYQNEDLVYSISFSNQGELSPARTRDIIHQARGIIASRGYDMAAWKYPGLRAV